MRAARCFPSRDPSKPPPEDNDERQLAHLVVLGQLDRLAGGRFAQALVEELAPSDLPVEKLGYDAFWNSRLELGAPTTVTPCEE